MFLDKLNFLSNLNQRISYNLFSLMGYILIGLSVCTADAPETQVFLLWNITFFENYSFLIIFYFIEHLTNWQLPFEFMKKTGYTIFLLIGTLAAFVFFVCKILMSFNIDTPIM